MYVARGLVAPVFRILLVYACALQELKQEPCPAELLTLDTPVTYKYTPTGNGALLDRTGVLNRLQAPGVWCHGSWCQVD